MRGEQMYRRRVSRSESPVAVRCVWRTDSWRYRDLGCLLCTSCTLAHLLSLHLYIRTQFPTCITSSTRYVSTCVYAYAWYECATVARFALLIARPFFRIAIVAEYKHFVNYRRLINSFGTRERVYWKIMCIFYDL